MISDPCAAAGEGALRDVAPGTDLAADLGAELTIHRATELQALLAAAIDGGVAALDLSRVTECDSAGIQLLCAARHSARSHGVELRLDAPSPALLEVLRRCGLDGQLRGLAAGAA